MKFKLSAFIFYFLFFIFRSAALLSCGLHADDAGPNLSKITIYVTEDGVTFYDGDGRERDLSSLISTREGGDSASSSSPILRKYADLNHHSGSSFENKMALQHPEMRFSEFYHIIRVKVHSLFEDLKRERFNVEIEDHLSEHMDHVQMYLLSSELVLVNNNERVQLSDLFLGGRKAKVRFDRTSQDIGSDITAETEVSSIAGSGYITWVRKNDLSISESDLAHYRNVRTQSLSFDLGKLGFHVEVIDGITKPVPADFSRIRKKQKPQIHKGDRRVDVTVSLTEDGVAFFNENKEKIQISDLFGGHQQPLRISSERVQREITTAFNMEEYLGQGFKREMVAREPNMTISEFYEKRRDRAHALVNDLLMLHQHVEFEDHLSTIMNSVKIVFLPQTVVLLNNRREVSLSDLFLSKGLALVQLPAASQAAHQPISSQSSLSLLAG